MIVELVRYRDPGSTTTSTHVERQKSVRSFTVGISQGPDGDRYPRVSINTPSKHSSVGLRPDGVTEVEVFDDLVHDAREQSVLTHDEGWIKTVVPRSMKRKLHAIAVYGPDRGLSVDTDVVRRALGEYLERYDFSRLPDDVTGDGWVDRDDPDCPRCGRDVAGVSVNGPSEAFVSPCGCRVPHSLLTIDRDRSATDADVAAAVSDFAFDGDVEGGDA